MLESAIVRSILTWLNAQPDCQAMKVHGTVFTANQPDIVGCCRGRMFAFEVKVPGAVPRPAQQSMLRKWSQAGAITAAPTSAREARAVIELMRSIA